MISNFPISSKHSAIVQSESAKVNQTIFVLRLNYNHRIFSLPHLPQKVSSGMIHPTSVDFFTGVSVQIEIIFFSGHLPSAGNATRNKSRSPSLLVYPRWHPCTTAIHFVFSAVRSICIGPHDNFVRSKIPFLSSSIDSRSCLSPSSAGSLSRVVPCVD